MNVQIATEQGEWDDIVRRHDGHPLQLWGWGELKSAHRWRAHRLTVTDEAGEVIGGAQVLERPLPAPFGSLLYVPRGPFGSTKQVLPAVSAYCREHFSATHLSIEPHQTEPITVAGWRRVAKAILLPQTIVLDLQQPEEALLSAMTKKTRQYIRKSLKDGVAVREGKVGDLDACLAIYHQTAERAGFGLHDDTYYRDLHTMLGDASRLFVAEIDGTIVAFVWLIVTPAVAFELYGGVNDAGQRARANYSLKWHAITQCQQEGIQSYDVNGLLNDGVSTFKRGFASHETTLAGSYDYPLSGWYPVWHYLFPVAKKGLQIIKSLRK